MMKAKMVGLMALLLAGAATGALAQERHGHGGWRGGGEGGGWHGRDAGQAPQAPPAPQAQPAAQAPQAPAPQPPQAGGWRGGGGAGPGWQGGGDRQRGEWQGRGDRQGRVERYRGGDQPTTTAPAPSPERRDWSGERDGRRDWNRDRGDRRDWNRNDGRRDWNRGGSVGRWESGRYPHSYRSERRFRAPAWRAPRGYYSRAWAFGEILPYGWYGRDYWVDGWWDYGLPEPPPGYHWVRVGDDALLVDDFDGRIVQIVRDLFW
jgi:Ni/Co efflux regulator RcnB